MTTERTHWSLGGRTARRTMRRATTALFMAAAFLAGIFLHGCEGSAPSQTPAASDPARQEEPPTAQADPGQVWTCSMHPEIRESEPGKCTICGMDLIPVSREAGDDRTSQ